MLGRELEVPLDATPPDAPSLKTDYAQAVQKTLASAHDLARRHLKKAAIRARSGTMINGLLVDHLLLVILFS